MKNRKKLKTDKTTINQTNENCQVFNGPISGCVFAMPGATVNQSPVQHIQQEKPCEDAMPNSDPDRGVALPGELSTPEAQGYWQRLREAGYVDEYYQPTISRTQAALLADAMAERLGIQKKWKVFEELWNRRYMRSDYNLALTRKRSLDFQDELKQLFG